MKRFYSVVSHRRGAAGYDILLDGRPVKTPFKNTLCAVQAGLADALVQEWSAQSEKIIPDTMPLTQILSTKIDKVSAERAAMSAEILKFFNTDLVCYFADAPPALVAKQQAVWNPVLDWFAQKFGYTLQTTNLLVALEHPAAAHDAVRDYVEALDDDRFTIVQLVTPLAGSIILALAFVDGALDAQQLFECTHVEEAFKAAIYDEEKYGPDPAQEKKDAAMMVDLKASAAFLEFLCE